MRDRARGVEDEGACKSGWKRRGKSRGAARAHVRACACARARVYAGGVAGGGEEGRRGRRGEERRGRGTRGVVMVRGKEGARKRACKRALAISVRVAPERK